MKTNWVWENVQNKTSIHENIHYLKGLAAHTLNISRHMVGLTDQLLGTKHHQPVLWRAPHYWPVWAWFARLLIASLTNLTEHPSFFLPKLISHFSSAFERPLLTTTKPRWQSCWRLPSPFHLHHGTLFNFITLSLSLTLSAYNFLLSEPPLVNLPHSHSGDKMKWKDCCGRGLALFISSLSPRAGNRLRPVRHSVQTLRGCQKFSNQDEWFLCILFKNQNEYNTAHDEHISKL